MKLQYYYHITKPEFVSQILKEGLKPDIGEHSKQAGETEPAIYLCRFHDLPYWKIILGEHAVLKISNINIDETNKKQYTTYQEALYYKPIPPEHIQHIHTPEPQIKHMHMLCIDYLYTLCFICVACAKYYTYPDQYGPDRKDELNCYLNSFLIIKDKLNYKTCTQKELRICLSEYGKDGEYTFLDTYKNTDKRLYEMLIEYPKDDLFEKRNQTYQYIKRTFPGCLSLYTGGWTG